MKCPACGVENPEGAKVCTACGKDMAAAPAASAPAPAAPAAAKPRRRRYHWFAVIGLIMAAVAPIMRVWADAAGGPVAAMLTKMMGGGGANAAASAKADYAASTLAIQLLTNGAYVFLAIGIIVGVIAVYQLLARKTGVGTVLGLGALVLSAAVLMAETYGDALPIGLSARLGTMGRDTGNYHWQTTVVVLLAAIIIECIVGLARPKPVAK
jgi:hypothetical protein